MTLEKKLPEILADNDLMFILHLESIINSIDEFCYGKVEKTGNYYLFRLNPSLPMYINDMIKQLNIVNNFFGLRAEFSKSIKSSNNLTFKIWTNNNQNQN